MTFCVAIKVKDGLVGIADTRVMSGSECIVAKKVAVYQHERSSLFVMVSGLRSVSGKALTYFDEIMEDSEPSRPTRLFHVANLLAEQIRRVASEDKKALDDSGLTFDIQALVGGQLERDREHRLYLVYPQGNWVEVDSGTPYQIIGASGYGKPVLDRTLKYEDSLRFALKVGCLAFDSTRISAANVDFPVDVALYLRDRFQMIEHRFQKQDLAGVSNWWQERLRDSVRDLPTDSMDPLLSRLPEPMVMPLPRKEPAMDAG
jgi:putative proteasome-type protease